MSNGIIKLCSRITFDEDTDINESVLRILNGEEEIRIEIIVKDASEPFGNNPATTRKNYECFASVNNRKGVYVFQKKNTGEVLYAGRSGFEGSQHLKERVKQHYQKKGSGANFRINWAKSNCTCEGNCSGESNGCFRRYLDLIRQSRVIFFCIFNNNDAASKQACVLESWLGLQSRYSRH